MNFAKNNMNLIIILIVFFILSSGTIYATTLLSSNQVSYKNDKTVQQAIDELYENINTWIDPSTIIINSTGKILASSKGIILIKNNNAHFLKISNWDVEKNHLQQVFSNISCWVEPYQFVDCDDSYFHCRVSSDGNIYCYVENNSSGCFSRNGTIECN